jgi:hypothetical protein
MDDSSITYAASRIPLGFDSVDLARTRAHNQLVLRAMEAHGIALHFADDTPEDQEDAMRAALGRVAAGMAAGALIALARDPVLKLTAEQALRVDELAIELDVDTVQTLTGEEDTAAMEALLGSYDAVLPA